MIDFTDRLTETTHTHLGPLTRGRRVTQRVRAARDLLTGVSLWFATYKTRISSTATLTICDEAGRELRRATFPTDRLVDCAWQRVDFEPIADTAGRVLWLSFETDADSEAVTLWTNTTAAPAAEIAGEPASAAVCFECSYVEDAAFVLDDLLGSAAPPPGDVDGARRAALRAIVGDCVRMKDQHLLRLVHLADAVGRAGEVRTALSVGCGMAYHEAFLAARMPALEVDAVDIAPGWRELELPNLRFHRRDILEWDEPAGYDLVYSIETIEHIADWRRAFAHIASKARRPGGFLYVAAPFASPAEQADERIAAEAWRAHGHVVPGYALDDMRALFADHGFDVVHASTMMSDPLANRVNALLARLDADTIEAALAEIAIVFKMDVNDRIADSMRRDRGIRVLGRRA